MKRFMILALLTAACTVQQPPPAPPPTPVVEVSKEVCPPPAPLAEVPPPVVSPQEQKAVERYRKTGKAEILRGPRTVKYPFGLSESTVYCQRLNVCTIALEPGEVVTDSPSCGDCGDEGQWVVDGKRSGKGKREQQIVTVKPKEFAGNTNLVIYTDRRIYYVRLVVRNKQRDLQVSWYYPQEE